MNPNIGLSTALIPSIINLSFGSRSGNFTPSALSYRYHFPNPGNLSSSIMKVSAHSYKRYNAFVSIFRRISFYFLFSIFGIFFFFRHFESDFMKLSIIPFVAIALWNKVFPFFEQTSSNSTASHLDFVFLPRRTRSMVRIPVNMLKVKKRSTRSYCLWIVEQCQDWSRCSGLGEHLRLPTWLLYQQSSPFNDFN